MAENYGLPYTGSKSRIAHWVIDQLPRGRVLIDAFVADNERANIRSRQAEGIAQARARGVRFGRPSIPPPSNWAETIEALERGELTQKQAADRLNMPLSTFRYRLNKCKE